MADALAQVPIPDEYAELLGKVLFTFARVEWQIVYLGSLYSNHFLDREAGNDSYRIAREFQIIADATTAPDLSGIAARFIAVEAERAILLRSIPFTASGNLQRLRDDVSNQEWTLEDVKAYGDRLATLDIDANGLYYAEKQSK